MACCPSPCRRDNVLAWLLCSDPSHVLEALGVLCALAQESRRALVEQILRESSRKQCAVVLTTLLRSPDPWLCSSAAYIFGALLENEALVQELQEWTPGDNNPVGLLAQLLARDDPNTVMYSAGAVASLAESSEGRKWLLKRDDICRQVLDHLPQLLENIRDSTVNSAALILARLCLCEVACQSLLSHSSAADTIKRLVQCLGHGHTDTAMNAAFAVGRLCGSELGRTLILAEAREHKLVSSLQTLLCKEAGPDAGQTACFALSCLATDTDGHTLLLDSPSFPSVLDGLFQLLLRKEPDCAWFAAMTVKVFVSRPSGVLRVRQHRLLEQQLQSLSSCPFLGLELQEEVNGCLRKLQRLPKPFPVRVNRLIQGSYAVTWEPCVPESGLEVTYSLLNKDSILYCGPMCHMTIPPSLLASGKTLFLQLKLSTSDGDTSPCSEPAVFETEKVRQRPGPPRELLVIGCTATQVRLRWIAPEGEVKPKKYRIFRENVLLETTGELGVIVGGLSPGTHYQLRVCAVGPGDMLGPGAEVQVHTVEFQDHAPSTLSVAVLGRHELHISWGAPVVPLGRLFNYEVRINGSVAYLGTERVYTARRLSVNTAYTCVVTAITSRGRCQSRPITKRTARCQYYPNRQVPVQTANPAKAIKEPSEVSGKVRKPPSSLGRLPGLLHTPSQPEDVAQATDGSRILSGPTHHNHKKGSNSKKRTVEPVAGLQSGQRPQKTADTNENPGSVSHKPVRSRAELDLLTSHSLCQKHTLLRAKTNPGMVLPWKAQKGEQQDKGRFPLINSHSKAVRIVQPVSYTWTELDWRGHLPSRLLRDRQTGSRPHCHHAGRHCFASKVE